MTHAEKRTRRKKMAEAVRDGSKPSEVAVEYGVVLETVYNACREHGVPPALFTPGKVSAPTTYALIAKLMNTDTTLTALAEQFTVSVERVSRVYRSCIDAGIPVRRRSQGRRKGEDR